LTPFCAVSYRSPMLARRGVLLVGALLLAGCGGSGKPHAPTASVTAPPTSTTAAQTVEQQVEAAYLHSWDVFADAVRRLDPSHLAEVYAAPHLNTAIDEINDRIRSHRPSRVSIEHHVDVQVIDSSTAA